MSAALSRPQICSRIQTLRTVLILLYDVRHVTGGEPFATVAAVKLELADLERMRAVAADDDWRHRQHLEHQHGLGLAEEARRESARAVSEVAP